MHCVVWRSSSFSPYQSGPAYHYVFVCSVVCGMRGITKMHATINIKFIKEVSVVELVSEYY